MAQRRIILPQGYVSSWW